eukprot:COSAG02_NODE_26409_length_633_cov_3.653558_1_plen_68_part_01
METLAVPLPVSTPCYVLAVQAIENYGPKNSHADNEHKGLMLVVTPTKSGHNARRWCGHTCAVSVITLV